MLMLEAGQLLLVFILGVDDALMLDMNGFVAETNSCNFFLVRDGVIYTPPALACLPGLTRNLVINRVSKNAGFVCIETHISLTDVYTASECFTTGGTS
jgi:branched-subunit amino acid aminotransferase/4-amino-4-deoxychorismate lyase